MQHNCKEVVGGHGWSGQTVKYTYD